MSSAFNPAISNIARKALVTGALIFVVASWLLEGVDVVNDRADRLQHGITEIENINGLLREYTASRIASYRQTLNGLAPAIDADRLTDPAAANDIHTALKRRHESTVGYLQFWVTDEIGVLRHSSETPTPSAIHISEGTPYKVLKTGKIDDIYITPAMVGMYGSAASKWVIVATRRLEKKDGTFAGALSATIAISELTPIFSSLNLGPNSIVGVVHLNGSQLLRVPDHEKFVGNDISNSPFLQTLAQNPERGVAQLSEKSGPRYQVYQRVPGTPLVVYVSASSADLLAPWRASIITTLIEQSALTALVIFLTYMAFGGLKRREAAEAGHLSRLERLAEITNELMEIHEQDKLLKKAADAAREIVPSHQSIVKFQVAGGAKGGINVPSLSDRYAKWRDYDVTPDGSGIYRLVMENNKPMRLTQDALEHHPAWRNFGAEKERHPPLHGWLATPLVAANGQNIGVIQLSDRVAGDFDATDEAILAQFARVVSIAIQTIQLLEETQAAAVESRMARDEMSKVFAATSDGIVIFDQDLRYTYVNDVFCSISATPREQILGRKFTDRTNYDPKTLEKLKECRATGKNVEFENAFIAPDGVQRWIEVKAFPVDEKISVFVRDITERRTAEQKLMEAQRMDAMGRLTGGLAHDFNNMLAVILGNTEMLLAKVSDHTQIRSAELIRTAAKRGADVISRLLSFARRQPLDPKALDVAGVVREVQTLLRRSLPENIAFEFVQGAGLWRANADLSQLENVLVNLVINARDALPDGGKITIEAANSHLDHSYATNADVPPGQYVLLAVSDTGTGMSPEVATKAFEPFFTTKGVGKGTGLGLSMVYGFAKQSGGHVRLYTEPGQGTTVKLYLPRAHGASEATVTHDDAQTPPRGTETILLVEDEDMVREFVQVMLVDLGYRVISHRDAEAAWIEIAAGLKPDVLLSDLVLPGSMNGRQLAEKIAKVRPNISILYMSGYTENAIVHHGRLDPGVNLLTKPFRRYDLAVKLRAVLNSNKASTTNA